MDCSRLALAMLASSLLLLTGCSGSGAGTPTPTPSASIDCSDPDITMGEWTEHCAGVEEGEPGDADATPQHGEHAIPLGETFEYTRVYQDSEGTTWSIKLANVKCGLKSLPESEGNPEWDGSDDIPEYIDAKAPAGSEFCVLRWDWKNIGKKPDDTIASGDLMFGDEQFARPPEDTDRSWNYMKNVMGVDYSDKINPRKSTKSADVYTVDEGTVPDAVIFPMETAVDLDYFLVKTR